MYTVCICTVSVSTWRSFLVHAKQLPHFPTAWYCFCVLWDRHLMTVVHSTHNSTASVSPASTCTQAHSNHAWHTAIVEYWSKINKGYRCLAIAKFYLQDFDYTLVIIFRQLQRDCTNVIEIIIVNKILPPSAALLASTVFILILRKLIKQFHFCLR